MYPRTSRRNGCCSDQQSFHQLLKYVERKRLRVAGVSEKRTPWWNQEVKATRAKKNAFKDWLQDRSSSDLQSLYNEARKAATSAVTKSKKKSWEEFGRQLNSNYFSANKVFWQTNRRLRSKRSSVTYSIKDSASNILTDENEILSRWREYLEDLLTPVKASTRDSHKVNYLREKEVFTEGEVATICIIDIKPFQSLFVLGPKSKLCGPASLLT